MRCVFSLALLALLATSFAPSSAGEDSGKKWKKFSLSFKPAPARRSVLDMAFNLDRISLPAPTGRIAFKTDEMEMSGYLRIDASGDGKPDTKVKEGRPVFFRVKFGDGKTGPYALRFFHKRISWKGPGGGDVPDFSWHYETATSMAGNVGGAKFAIEDVNCNGRFDELGFDAVRVGGAEWSIPLGQTVLIKKKLYDIKVDPGGKSVSIREFTGPTGTLDMTKKFKAPGKLRFAVVFCKSAGFFADLSRKGGRKVPTGEYILFVGRIDGKGNRSCRVGGLMNIKVRAQTTTEPEWGTPLMVAFPSPERRNSRVAIAAWKPVIAGRGGETYSGFRRWKDYSFNDLNHEFTVTVRSKNGSVACSGRVNTQDEDGDVGSLCSAFNGVIRGGLAPFTVVVQETRFSDLIGPIRGEARLK